MKDVLALMSSQISKKRANDPANRPPVFDRLRSRKKPTTRRVELALDPQLALDHAEAEVTRRVLAARLAEIAEDLPEHDRVKAELKEAETKEAEAEGALSAETTVFVFRNIGGEAYDDLKKEHPATPEQDTEWKAQYGRPAPYNTDTFNPALVAASIVSVDDDETEWSVQDVQALFADDAWNRAEVQQLINAALEVNESSRVVELGKGRGRTH